MKNDSAPEVPDSPAVAEARGTRRNVRRAIGFGIVMATLEMGIVLYFMYC